MIMVKKTPEEKRAEKVEKRRNLINEDRLEPNINYKYWLEVSKKRQDNPTNGTFSSMLTILRNNLSNTDVIWEVVNDENRAKQTMNGFIKKGFEYANEIFYELNKDDLIKFNQDKIDTLFLGIFDIVQGWGGIMGKTPYNSRSSYGGGVPGRHTPNKWLKIYKEAVSLIKNGDFRRALLSLDNSSKNTGIKGLRISFASKHLWFWGNYFKSKGLLKDKSVHVYDTRIARMLYGREPESQDYDHVSELYDNIIKTNDLNDMSHSDIEQALFAFSNTFYDNDLKHFHSDYNEDPLSKDALDEDIKEAKSIFCKRNKGACENGEPKEAFKDLRSVSDVTNEEEDVTGLTIPQYLKGNGLFITRDMLKKGYKSKKYDAIKKWVDNPQKDLEKIEPKGDTYNALKYIRDEPEPFKTTKDLDKEIAQQKREAKEKKEAESAGKARSKKEDAEKKIKAREKAESLLRFPTDIDSMDDDTLKLKGSNTTFIFKDFESDLRKELERAFVSTELVDIRRHLRTVDPKYLNDNWREVRGYSL
jgi:hypothetical protein